MISKLGIADHPWCHHLFVCRWRLLPAGVFSFASAVVFTLAMMTGAHPFTESLDWVLHGEPNIHFLQASLGGGEIPWWNPHVGLGRPYVSDLQSAVFYPPTYLLFCGKSAGPSFFLGLHAFLATFGMHLLCRQLGGRGVFGLLGGCALLGSMGFGGRLLVGHTFYFAGLCYLPVLLAALVKLRLRPTINRAGTFSLLLAVQFLTGHPQVFWNSVLGLGLLLVGMLARLGPAIYWRRALRVIACFAAALLLAGGITAIAWMPFLDLITEGNRQATTLKIATYGHFALADLFSFVTEPPVEYKVNWEQNCRLGFAWTVPGLVGLCLFRSIGMRALLLMGAAALWFSFGESSWLFRQCFDYLPGASSFRLPSRISVLPLVALTAAGAVFLGRSKPSGALPEAGFIAVGCLAVALLRGFPFEAPGVQLGLFAPMMALLAAAISIHVWRHPGQWPTTARITALLVWLGLQAVEFSSTHSRYARRYSEELVSRSDGKFHFVDGLKKILPASSSGIPPRVMVLNDLVPPNLGMQSGWTHVDSYTALFLRRPWNYLHAAFGVAPPLSMNASLSAEVYERPPFSVPNLSLDLALDVAAGGLVRPSSPVPRLWITFQPRLVSRPEEALAAVTNRLDLPREGVVEKALPFPPSASGDASGSAEILRFRHSEIEVKCRLSHPGLLVLNEAWFPGWHAVVAGQRIESQPVNYWMRGFALPAGEHHLKLKFRPRHQALAACLTLGSLSMGLFMISRRQSPWKKPDAQTSAGQAGTRNA